LSELLRKAAENYPENIPMPFGQMMVGDGFDAICIMTEEYGGRQSYIPSLRSVFSKCIEAQARMELIKEGPGHSIVARLAKKYGYTERHMRRLIC